MAAPIQVGTTATLISRTAAKPYLINNDGSVNVYLGQDTAVNANNYAFILQPGQSLSWSEINKEVWAVTTTSTSKVSIAYEAAAVASSTVNISNATIPVTGTVNANITNASIPVSGSVAISSGNVNVTAGTVSVSNGNITAAVGNVPLLIGTLTTNITTGGTTSIANSSPIDISPYSSIILRATFTKTGGGATTQTLGAGAYFTMGGAQNPTSSPGIAQSYFEAQYTYPTGGATGIGQSQTLQVPVTNRYLVFTGSVVQTAVGFNTGTIVIEAYGSYETITTTKYQNLISVNFGSGAAAQFENAMLSEITTATSTDYDIPTKNGEASITLASGSTTNTRAALNISYYYNGSSYFLTNLALVAPGLTTLDYGEKDLVILPMLPVHVAFRQTGTTPQSRYSIIQ